MDKLVRFCKDTYYLPSFIFNFNLPGYGHIAPKTVGGKMFCLLYALIGIPLMIVFSGHIGDLMADGFRWLYSRICCRWCRVRRWEFNIIWVSKHLNLMSYNFKIASYLVVHMYLNSIMRNCVQFKFLTDEIMNYWKELNEFGMFEL